MENTEKILDISWKTIFKIAITVVIFYVIFSIRDILIWFIFALTISILFNPAIDFLMKKRVPRSLAVVSIYGIFFGVLGFVVYMMVPVFVAETQRFSDFFPQYFEGISPILKTFGFEVAEDVETFFKVFESNLAGVSKNIFSALFAVFGGVFAALFVIIMAAFLSLEGKAVERSLILLFPKDYEAQVSGVWQKCRKKVAGWFGGRLLACLFVGIASYVVFLIFSVKYPFTLALFAGVLNFIPYVGPLVTGILIFLMIFPTNQLVGIFVIIAFIIIQQIENSILTPMLMKKFVGLPPVLVLVSLVVGASLWGFLGAILAVPLFGIMFEFLKGFLEKRRDRQVVTVE